MTFQAPLLLLLLVAVPLVAVLYALMQRRRRKYAVTFTNVDLLAAVAGRSYTRHLPAVFALLALAALLSRSPARSGRSTPSAVRPTSCWCSTRAGRCSPPTSSRRRLAAAQLAGKTFTDAVPDEFRIGVIGFGSSAQQLTEPTTDHAAREGDDPEPAGRGRDRDGRRAQARVQLRARARCRTAWAGRGGCRRAIVLLGDGSSTRGNDPIDIVQDSKKYKIPVYTVALGTPERHAHPHRPEHGRDQHRARPAGPADAAGHRARHRRPVLRHRRRATGSPPCTATSARG